MNIYLSKERTHIGKITTYATFYPNTGVLSIFDHNAFYANYDSKNELVLIGGSLSEGIYNSTAGRMTMPEPSAPAGTPQVAYDIYV